jgi:cell division protein FtsA
VVTIPGISGRDPKEISFKSLAYIIQSRMEEIIDAVIYEIENSGYMEKLSAGIVLTGGGSMLKHLNQLVKFKTGLDVRIGFPGEMMVAETADTINQPMFSTSVGLLLKGLEYYKEHKESMEIRETQIQEEPADAPEEAVEETAPEDEKEEKKGWRGRKRTKSFVDGIKSTLGEIFDESDVNM